METSPPRSSCPEQGPCRGRDTSACGPHGGHEAGTCSPPANTLKEEEDGGGSGGGDVLR